VRVNIMGKVWDLIFISPKNLPKDRYADCDPPEVKGKVIRVSDKLTGEILIDTIIHECFHAGSKMQLDEDFIDRFASDIARVICKDEVLKRIVNTPKCRKLLLEILADETARQS
jgi:hypothetical protein